MTQINPNLRFTIFAFPQNFDGSVLKVNIVFLPRNQNPLAAAINGSVTIPDAPSFATAKISFVAKIINSLENFPVTTSPISLQPLVTAPSGDRTLLFQALASQFQISNLSASNANITTSIQPPVKTENSVKKYLPLSYRKSFNFINPVVNGKIDDSYQCALKKIADNSGFTPSADTISWGQVFSHIMRQPLLAQQAGMVYETKFVVDPSLFNKGGWLYIDLADTSDYKAQQNADSTFIKLYAARIPPLKMTKSRAIFAPVLFPVLPVEPAGDYDNIFIEASDYDDGFAKIVHSFQPVSQNFLEEESDGFHPLKEMGIRLGWDDEQILTWYIRALAEDSSVGAGMRIDAPLGVNGYKIDVRKQGNTKWDSLNFVTSKAPLAVAGQILGKFSGELNYQVYPSQINGDISGDYWLPMYFANWAGKSMVLHDDDATEIYQNNSANLNPNPDINVTGPVQNQLNKIYSAQNIPTHLQYGNIYEFRVRLGDMSGGGPAASDEPVYAADSPIATTHFLRFVAPNPLRIEDLPSNTTQLFNDSSIKIQRPLLGYPCVVLTGKYADPISLLKTASQNLIGKKAFGISDPDVSTVEITVEIKALQMDNLLSETGMEPYIKFFTTSRSFPAVSATFDDQLTVPLKYVDASVLNFGDESDLGNDFGYTKTQIDGLQELPLPTGRGIRLTLRAVCKEIEGYYGLQNSDHDLDSRYGSITQILLSSPSENEQNLLLNTSPASQIEGIFLQPDPETVFDGNAINLLIGNTSQGIPDIMQRFSQQLGIQNSGLMLVGNPGQRIQFGCSNGIGHTLSPDSSSLTISTKEDLIDHWLVCLKLEINRDWCWDALQDTSFVIKRTKRFQHDATSEEETEQVGVIEIRKAASILSLQNPDRTKTVVMFIDAVEPKSSLMQPAPHQTELRFPDLIELEYTVTAQFKEGYATQKDKPLKLNLTLPITTNPAQLPEIVSAGIALSPYNRNETYSSTNTRQKYLWIEFSKSVSDSKDNYFARVLASAPDQLISNNNPELFSAPVEPPLSIDPEYIRVITPDQSIDTAGLNAMQPMQKASDSDKHYLLPLPPGLNSESPELFGFFTYEIRIGHYKYKGTNQNVWTTAQGRFGRALRLAGVQHPAPTLLCSVNRDNEKLYVSAPYAVSIFNGKNVTSNPPRTQLWALLYAQVKQADNKDYRNVLLDEKKLDWRVQIDFNPPASTYLNLSDQQIEQLKLSAIQNWNPKLGANIKLPPYKLNIDEATNNDSIKNGTTCWLSNEILQLLELYGLPDDSSLSVLCVEVFSSITNIYEHINELDNELTKSRFASNFAAFSPDIRTQMDEASSRFSASDQEVLAYMQQPKPLGDDLGNYRILRTSPLTPAPFVCCTNC